MLTLNLSATQWEMALWIIRTAGLAMAMLVLTLALRHWRRSQERYSERMFEQIDLLRADLLQLHDLFEQQVAAATPITQDSPRTEPRAAAHVSASSTTATPRGYEVAVRLARSGATVDELISSCGLSRNEAQLVLRLHAKQDASHPAAGRDATADASVARESQREVAQRRARLSVVG